MMMMMMMMMENQALTSELIDRQLDGECADDECYDGDDACMNT